MSDTTSGQQVYLPPVSEEQAFLDSYFLSLSQFAFDKAREYAERERETRRSVSGNSIWGNLLSCLSILANAEKNYASLQYIGVKWFSNIKAGTRLKTIYASLSNDLQKLKQLHETGRRLSLGGEALLVHLAEQLNNFTQARQETMDFYEQLYTLGNQKNDTTYEELITKFSEIVVKNSKKFHHPIIGPLKSSFTLELEILQSLLQAHLDISRWHYLSALLKLHEAQAKLNSWAPCLQLKEVGKKKQTAAQATLAPPLYQWFLKFKEFLLSKFSLYFYEALNKQAPSNVEMKTLTAKLSTDYYAKIVVFQRRTDAFNISLVFDINGREGGFGGHGYHHPNMQLDSPTGLESYPTIFSYPSELPAKHRPNIVMLITEPKSNESVTHFYDKGFQNTYYIYHVEQRMTLIIVYEGKKSEKDSYINSFVQEMGLLGNYKIFTSLKPSK